MKKWMWILIIAVVLTIAAVVYAHEAKIIHTLVAILSFVAGVVAHWAWGKYVAAKVVKQVSGNGKHSRHHPRCSG